MKQHRLSADFAGLAPGAQGTSAAGDYIIRSWARASIAGRTDAGRPGLPLKGKISVEVYS